MLTGDQNMIEVTASVHYRVDRPEQYLFRQMDGDAVVWAAAESVLQSVVTSSPIDGVLTDGRVGIEERVVRSLQRRLDRYDAGVRVLTVRLLDVHPSLEVVDAFRDVAGAFEEKNRLINEAEGYRNEQVALARGNAEARLRGAAAYSAGRTRRAEGDAARFQLLEGAFALAPAIHRTRLYLETIDQVLPGRKKLIVDSSKGKRHLMLLENGVELGSPAFPLVAPGPGLKPED